MTPTDTQTFTFGETPEDRLVLDDGRSFGPITLAYATYGALSPKRDNAVLLFHALSGSHHAAGQHPQAPPGAAFWTEACHAGWWDDFIGPGRALDTDHVFVICVNYFGGCYGSTGPTWPNPETDRPWGGEFPIITVGDVVETQMRLLDHLGIECLLGAVGGSLGGAMAMELSTRHPDRVRCVIPIATGARANTLNKLYNFEQIFAIEEDPNFNRGDYHDGAPPKMGLMLARMIAHKTFVHLQVIEDRARREIVQAEDDLKGYRLHNQIESYMLHHAKKFVERFDANTYLRILNMWQDFDLARSAGGDLAHAFAPCVGQDYLVFSIDSDVCYWPEEQAEICDGLRRAGVRHRHITVHSFKGHDAFLLEPDLFAPSIAYLLRDTLRTAREA